MTIQAKPSKAQRQRLVRLLAQYILKDGTYIKTQQKAYDKWITYYRELEQRFPKIDWVGSMPALTEAAKREAKKKVFRGPGSTS